MDGESLKLLRAQGLSVERIARRFGKDPSTVACGGSEQGGGATLAQEGCRVERVARHRRQVKQLLVEEAGGCCCICGYHSYLGALVFHHLEPSEKRLQISWNGLTQSLATVRAEVRKCVLLCSNCHAEVEAGVVGVPAKVDGSSQEAIHHNLG